jgi:hypothetical protein
MSVVPFRSVGIIRPPVRALDPHPAGYRTARVSTIARGTIHIHPSFTREPPSVGRAIDAQTRPNA